MMLHITQISPNRKVTAARISKMNTLKRRFGTIHIKQSNIIANGRWIAVFLSSFNKYVLISSDVIVFLSSSNRIHPILLLSVIFKQFCVVHKQNLGLSGNYQKECISHGRCEVIVHITYHIGIRIVRCMVRCDSETTV